MNNNNVVILEEDAQNIEIIEAYLQELDEFKIDKTFNDYQEGLEYIKNTQPQLVIYAIANNDNYSNLLLKELVETNSNIIVLSENYSTNLVIQALRIGAKDFIQKPIVKKDFHNAIKKCSQSKSTKIEKSTIISIFSNKGGIGKTAISTNLAVEFARQTREKVILVDLNLPLGDVTTFINIKPTVNIATAIDTAKHKGEEAVLNACKKYKDTSLYVLAEPFYTEDSHDINPQQVSQLFEYLRDNFAYIIVDLGASIDKTNIKILELSDIILLVSIVNLPLIRNCQRCLDLFNNLKFKQDKTKIIVNRYIENDEIKIEDVEKVLHQKIYWKIPNNYFSIMSSINKAMPVSELNENSNVTLSFSGLTTKLIESIIAKDFD